MTITTAAPDSRIREELDELPVLARGELRCECNHGKPEDYRACGGKARWRVTIECTCGGGHARRVELLCTQCLSNRRRDLERESITIRPV